MAAFYLDSSGLAKRYVAEPGSAWILRLVAPSAGHDLYTVRLAGPELIAALVRRIRGGRLEPVTGNRAVRRFRLHWQGRLYHVVEADRGVLDLGMDIAEAHGLRGYDAVHVAAAIRVEQQRQAEGLPGLTFISADREQLHAAAAEGLLTDDPNLHP